MLYTGIILGLLVALCQSFCYIANRHFVQQRVSAGRSGAGQTLLVLSHIHMGIFSLLVLPFFWPSNHVNWSLSLPPLIFICIFYLLGQVGLTIAIRHGEPSRVSPLLGFKLIVLAGIATTLGSPLTALQWIAVVVCVTGALLLYHAGGKLHSSAIFGIILACIAYSLSDWNIKRLVDSLDPSKSVIWRSLFAALLCYGLCGLMVTPFLPWWGSKKIRDWTGAIPFAAAWFAAMVALYACFGFIGVVYGTILQSTRGLLSILLGAALTKMGVAHLEGPVTRAEFLRRVAAGSLMFLAVVLYGMKVWPSLAQVKTFLGL